jgi:hypothetical protein
LALPVLISRSALAFSVALRSTIVRMPRDVGGAVELVRVACSARDGFYRFGAAHFSREKARRGCDALQLPRIGA